MQTIHTADLGFISYEKALQIQTKHFDSVIEKKLINRSLGSSNTSNFLFLCEHPHVYTIGRSGNKNNLLKSEQFLNSIGASYFETNRGGDITYHGPGQLVLYPILDLDNFTTDIHLYMRNLEEVVIKTSKFLGVNCTRIKGLTGVWTDKEDSKKICAMGVKMSRWVSMHGLALNVNTNLDYFNYIVPCGIVDKGVTSLNTELGSYIEMNLVKQRMLQYFSEVFDSELKEFKL